MKVSYLVTLDLLRNELRVQFQLSELAPGETMLMTPAWVPGNEDFERFGRDAFDLFDVRAVYPASGKQLEMRLHGWSCYTVEPRGEALTVSYRAPASPMEAGVGARLLAGISGVPLGSRYLRVAAHDGPCLVKYDVPEGWTVRHPAVARAQGGNTWEYEDYEQLLRTKVSCSRLRAWGGDGDQNHRPSPVGNYL
ncbi:hypothetical protein LJR289_002553 [Pseudoduganella sp. LjRoot289]|uniref:M61 family metallopeptidase n=1 Tax=Pseudoduganella sp. LjRoot289 TaxID=3342314 RepID=UPI003ECE88B5